MLHNLKKSLPYIGFIITLAVGAAFIYGIFFLHADEHSGVIVDKLYVPPRIVSSHGVMNFQRHKSRDHFVSTQTQEQHLALVKDDEGNMLRVHCEPTHFQEKHIGDTLHFKEYKGTILWIDYISYSKED